MVFWKWKWFLKFEKWFFDNENDFWNLKMLFWKWKWFEFEVFFLELKMIFWIWKMFLLKTKMIFGTLIPYMILSITYDEYLLLFTTKSKQISELCQKYVFNGSTGVIGYADSWLINANITWQIF